MRNSYERMEKEIKELKTICMSKFDEDTLISLSGDELKLIQCCLRLIDASNDLTKNWIETMEVQDRKLTQILDLLESANLSKD